MKKHINVTENPRPTIDGGKYDTVVVGGGVAGIAAALSARRSGASVLLLEREYSLGGLATLGLVTIYLPICDGMGHQVSFSIAEELLRLSMSLGHEAKYPTPWIEGGSFEEKAKTVYAYITFLIDMLDSQVSHILDCVEAENLKEESSGDSYIQSHDHKLYV